MPKMVFIIFDAAKEADKVRKIKIINPYFMYCIFWLKTLTKSNYKMIHIEKRCSDQ